MQGAIVFPGHPEGTIQRISLSAPEVTLIAQHLDTPMALATAAGTLYWAEAGSLATYTDGSAQNPENLGTLGRIVRSGLDGSNPTTLADQQTQCVALAVDATHVYWANSGTAGGSDPQAVDYTSDGALLRVPLAGGPTEVVMPAIDARNLVLSTDAVFFSSWFYGLVMKIAKP
jgi:hypothetical protein